MAASSTRHRRAWLTWLGALNFVLLQWLGIRLARIVPKAKPQSWALLIGVLPLTGWWSDYIGPTKLVFLRLAAPSVHTGREGDQL